MEDDGSPLNNFGKGLKKLFGKNRRGSGEDLTEQEIMSMVNEGHEHGVLQESEAEMINNIFTLDQKETDHGTGWEGNTAGSVGTDP